jgi:hypothetical protein
MTMYTNTELKSYKSTFCPLETKMEFKLLNV